MINSRPVASLTARVIMGLNVLKSYRYRNAKIATIKAAITRAGMMIFFLQHGVRHPMIQVQQFLQDGFFLIFYSFQA